MNASSRGFRSGRRLIVCLLTVLVLATTLVAPIDVNAACVVRCESCYATSSWECYEGGPNPLCFGTPLFTTRTRWRTRAQVCLECSGYWFERACSDQVETGCGLC